MSDEQAFVTDNRWRSARQLLFILGDQLDREHPGLAMLKPEEDVILMAEARHEAEYVPSHRQRTTLFLAAMRHHAQWLMKQGFRLRYIRLDDRQNSQTLDGELTRAIETLDPERIICMQPGEHRLRRAFQKVGRKHQCAIEFVENPAFTCSQEDFERWASERKQLVMEYFYRERRRALDVLVDDEGKPEGGKWNFDKENRERFKSAPDVAAPYQARPDAVTREVMALVEKTWPDAYGKMAHFHWPVTRAEALRALRRFVETRLAGFGTYEDAMWHGEAFLYHSLLSSSLNLGLLNPEECVEAALAAYQAGDAPLNSVEGFIRQLIGWREFIRGVYFAEGDNYAEGNALGHQGALPDWFWTGDTDLRCLADCLSSVVEHAYGHHIPRLMVIGNFALIAGIDATEVHRWFLAMYVDAVEWVTAPNVIGMSQHADGGIVGTKPYAGSGKYIQRMSNYCDECRYDVKSRSGEHACPFNVFYWDFLLRHRKRFSNNQRMAMILKNLDRMDAAEQKKIREQADQLREQMGIG